MRHRWTGVGAVATLAFAVTLGGCAPQTGGEVTPSPSRASTSTPTLPSTPTADAGPRFLIECVGTDGAVLGVFSSLEEAWASTNYVRIDHCTASQAPPGSHVLTSTELAVAEAAAGGASGADLMEQFLWTLATCVRVPLDGIRGLTVLPTSLLQAVLELCPEAPHAGLVEDELESRR